MWLLHKLRIVGWTVFRIVGPLWIAGLFILLLAILIEPHGEHASGLQRFAAAALSHIAVALLVGGLLVSVEKAVFFHELRDEMLRLLRLSQRVSESGLADIAPRDDRHYDGFRDLILSSRRLAVVVNYGKDWVANWRAQLSDRFGMVGTETDWFLVDPNSTFLAQLAEKQSLSAVPARPLNVATAELRTKVEDTIAQLKACYEASRRQGVLRIYLLPAPLFPTVSIYLGEKGGEEAGVVVLTFYTVSSEKGAVPLVVFKDTPARPNTFTFFQNDVQRLRDRLSPHWVGTPPSPVPPGGAVPPPALPLPAAPPLVALPAAPPAPAVPPPG